MLNAMQNFDNFHQATYDEIKKRIMANPLADKNRQRVLDAIETFLDEAFGDPDYFLRMMRRYADRLDALAQGKTLDEIFDRDENSITNSSEAIPLSGEVEE